MTEELLRNQVLDIPRPARGLRHRVVRGGMWVFALRITDRLFRLIRTIVLARLLAPADFGLFGIALLAMSALETFSQTGFNAALVQKKEDTKPYLDMAWTVQVIRGVVLGLIAFAIAPYVTTFFDAPAAKPILQVIAFSVLLGGFSNIGVIYFQKELKFHKLFVYQLSGTLADIGVAIPAAFLLRSVWALVFGLLAGNLVRIVLSYFIHPYRPRLGFNQQQFKELFGFGKWILGISIITFIVNQGDHAFLGRVLGVTALGFYQIAYRIGQLPATEFAKVISRVTFPAYSKLQDNVVKLKKGFLKTLNITFIFMIPLGGGIFILAPEFIMVFLTEKWAPVVPLLRILVIAGVIRAITTTGGAMFAGVGKPNLDYKMNVIRVIAMVLTIYPLTLFFGMSGVALAVALGNFACVLFWLVETIKIIRASLKEYLGIILPPFFGTLVMCMLLLPFKSMLSANLLDLVFMVIVGAVAYLALIYFVGKTLNLRALDDLKSLIYSCVIQ